MTARPQFDSIAEAEQRAARMLPPFLFDLLNNGGERNLTRDHNVAAFDEVSFRPHVGVQLGPRSMSTKFFDAECSLPVLIAPTGGQRLVHPMAEIAVARAARRSGSICVLSMDATYAATEVAREADGTLWQQIYMKWGRDAAVARIEDAAAAGCAALVMTVDLAAFPRPRALPAVNLDAATLARVGGQFVTHPRWARRFAVDQWRRRSLGVENTMLGTRPDNYSVTWEEMAWLRNLWSGPIVVKGVLRPDDAKRAVDSGANAVVVSNHGGKGLDSARPTLKALGPIVDAVADAVPVLIDGGIRRGGDVVKALALGAQATLIGRPFVWGLAVDGEEGVVEVLELLRHSIDRTLANLGCSSTADLDRSYLDVPSNWPRT
jgi:pre-mycofactocin synthase